MEKKSGQTLLLLNSMLSDDEKREMLEDANDLRRRKDFAYARELVVKRKLTGEEYIKFLTG